MTALVLVEPPNLLSNFVNHATTCGVFKLGLVL